MVGFDFVLGQSTRMRRKCRVEKGTQKLRSFFVDNFVKNRCAGSVVRRVEGFQFVEGVDFYYVLLFAKPHGNLVV